MRFALLLLLLSTGAVAADTKALPEWPRVGDERIVLHTNLGDIVLALYPDAAPKHVAQILKLVQLGIYDTTHFYKVDRNFMMQLSGAGRRRLPLSPAQAAALKPLKAEFTPYKHRYGVVTMAHDPDNVDSAVSSFLILFGDVPQLDGKFTIVGEVSRGHDVMEAIRNVPTDQFGQPLRRVEVEKAFVVENTTILERIPLAPAIERAVAEAEVLPEVLIPAGRWLLFLGIALFVLSLLVPRSALAPSLRASGLLLLLAGFFLLFAWYVPEAASHPKLAILLFVGTIGMFRLMSRFELSVP